MTPAEVAQSDGLKTQLMETGEMRVWVVGGRNVDQYIDAVRYVALEIGLSTDDIEININSDCGLKVAVKQ